MDPVHCRTGHIAVAHHGRLLVWGGYREDDDRHTYWSPEEVLVYDQRDLTWTTHRTRGGQAPLPTCGATAQVLNEELFVLCGFARDSGDENQQVEREENVNDVFALDLTTWTWRKLQPSGRKPAKCDKLTSWLYGDNIYIFGGFGQALPGSHVPQDVSFVPDTSLHVANNRGWNNQLVAYDTKENAWWWPTCSGHIPSPRAAHSSFIADSKAYIFGGRLQDLRMNDMFRLDMNSFQWELVKPMGKSLPCGRSWHSFTLTEDKHHAFLYGGYDPEGEPLGDCWLLDIPGNKWTRCQHLESGCRMWHQGVKEELSGQVWLLGGVVNNLLGQGPIEHPLRIVRLTLTPMPLLLLALKSVINEKQRLTLEFPKLPRGLQQLIQSCLNNNLSI